MTPTRVRTATSCRRLVLASVLGLTFVSAAGCSGNDESLTAGARVEAVPTSEAPLFDRWIVEEAGVASMEAPPSGTTVDRAPQEVAPSPETKQAVTRLEEALPESAGFRVVSVGEVLTRDGRPIHLATLRSATSVLKVQWQQLAEPLRLIPPATVENRTELGSYDRNDNGELLTVSLKALMGAGVDDYRLYHVTKGGEMTSINFVMQGSPESSPPDLTLEQLTVLVINRWGMNP